MKRALILGCGYTGIRLAARAAELGLEVTGTTRSETRAAEAAALRIEPLVGELVGRGILNRIAELAPHVVFYLVPPILNGPDPLLSVLELVTRPGLEAFVYASSTAVYGDRAGAWVDESDPQLGAHPREGHVDQPNPRR